MNSMGECGTDLFDAPDRSTLVKLTVLANERGSSAFENPDLDPTYRCRRSQSLALAFPQPQG